MLSSSLMLMLVMAINRFDSLGEVGSRQFMGNIMFFVIGAIVFAASIHVYLFRKYISNKE